MHGRHRTRPKDELLAARGEDSLRAIIEVLEWLQLEMAHLAKPKLIAAPEYGSRIDRIPQ